MFATVTWRPYSSDLYTCDELLHTQLGAITPWDPVSFRSLSMQRKQPVEQHMARLSLLL